MTSGRAAPDQGALRILHVSEVTWGGVPSLMRHFTDEQVRAGHEVHLLAPEDVLGVPGVVHHRWRLDRRHPLSVTTGLADLSGCVRGVRPDVVHLHSFVAGLLGRMPPRRLWLGDADVPVVYQPHAWSFALFNQAAASRAVRGWEAWATRNTDVLVTNCADEVEEGRSIGVDAAARVLGVAVDLERFHPPPPQEQQRLREELGVRADRVLVCVGRLAWQKGQDLLLQAWERWHPADTELVLVGPGDQEALRQHAPREWGRSVRAVGEQADVRPWIWASDALVLSSRYETVAVAAAEAMACGRPVIATAFNGAVETILDGPQPALPAAGTVVPLGDTDALVRAAALRLEDGSLRDREGSAGRQRAEARFAPQAVAARLEAAYRDARTEHDQGGRRHAHHSVT
jgi:glycosyltransferase involved in cell wall biosynthesis